MPNKERVSSDVVNARLSCLAGMSCVFRLPPRRVAAQLIFRLSREHPDNLGTRVDLVPA